LRPASELDVVVQVMDSLYDFPGVTFALGGSDFEE
jgi:hypothetical protein